MQILWRSKRKLRDLQHFLYFSMPLIYGQFCLNFSARNACHLSILKNRQKKFPIFQAPLQQDGFQKTVDRHCKKDYRSSPANRSSDWNTFHCLIKNMHFGRDNFESRQLLLKAVVGHQIDATLLDFYKVFDYFNSSLLWDIDKQKSPRCDAAERGVSSGAILFAWRNFIKNVIKIRNHS